MNEAGPPHIPGYDYLGPLGRGGFSDVHLYQQHMPMRQVAVKVLRVDTLDQRQRQAFTDEANTMAKLADHPNIVSVLSADITSDGRPYLVMSYYPGADLGQRVAQRPLALAEALRTGIQLACAVESAHRMHVLHRDIKPSNVLISRSGAPGLSDFGIAGSSQGLHEDEEIGVSIPWSAPEVLSGESTGSTATDVYSLGATLWHLLVGRSPFKWPGGDNSQSALMSRILRTPAPATGISDIPATLDRLLQQCMAKDPTHRPRSAHQLARELQQIEVQHNLSRTDLVVLDAEIEALGPRPGPTGPDVSLAERTVAKGPVRIDLGAEPAPARPTAGRATQVTNGAAEQLTLRKKPTQADAHAPARASRRLPVRARLVGLAVIAATSVVFALTFWLLSRGEGTGDQDPATTGVRTQQPPADLVAPPPPAPDVADVVRRGEMWVLRWRPIPTAEFYRYQEEGRAALVEVPPGGTEIRVPAGGDRRCFLVFAYSSAQLASPPSDRTCTPGASSG